MQKQSVLFAGISLALMAVMIQPAFAQYDISEKGLYEGMRDSKIKVEIATQEDAMGSGTPVFAADGIVGASVLSAGVFGGIAAMFFLRGRNGKYAAIGRG
ncbi:hypothetical protein [Nitrosopumilus sp.]|uniref:hypothetical protein n=1 Tax=Nitrosopumilus sp. TaxID=2024843 RepID=UPI00247B987C|nr:hypothetical protein [Nitrosopumilus sp.]MCV0431235.1 hypothetical protein [Nitrosopumilus sp.]